MFNFFRRAWQLIKFIFFKKTKKEQNFKSSWVEFVNIINNFNKGGNMQGSSNDYTNNQDSIIAQHKLAIREAKNDRSLPSHLRNFYNKENSRAGKLSEFYKLVKNDVDNYYNNFPREVTGNRDVYFKRKKDIEALKLELETGECFTIFNDNNLRELCKEIAYQEGVPFWGGRRDLINKLKITLDLEKRNIISFNWQHQDDEVQQLSIESLRDENKELTNLNENLEKLKAEREKVICQKNQIEGLLKKQIEELEKSRRLNEQLRVSSILDVNQKMQALKDDHEQQLEGIEKRIEEKIMKKVNKLLTEKDSVITAQEETIESLNTQIILASRGNHSSLVPPYTAPAYQVDANANANANTTTASTSWSLFPFRK